MSSAILGWVIYYSMMFNMDPALVSSVIMVESGGNPKVVGTHGEVGLMQVMPSNCGVTRKKLFDPRENIYCGVSYLRLMEQECKHKNDFTHLLCYNLGVAKASKVRYPKLFPYYKKVMAHYKQMADLFKAGQRVVVVAAYYGGSNGSGTIIKKARDDSKEYRGKWWVDIEGLMVPVEPERIVDEADFYNRKRTR